MAMSTTSLRPISPRVASTTSGGRPKTGGCGPISAPAILENDGVRTLTSLSDLTNTGVLVAKSGDESKRFTPKVDLVMDRTLGEKGSLTLRYGVDNETGSVLLDERSFHLTVNDEQELGRSGMGVGAVHSARSDRWFVLR